MAGPRFSHVAVTVARQEFAPESREKLLNFYGRLFGWRENRGLSIENERIFLRAPTDDQYLTIRASDQPMSTSGYEHLGVAVDSEAEIRALHERASGLATEFPEMELGELRTLYGGKLVTFRVRYRLPLTLELQFLA
jgi:hypothetical protein